MLRKVIVGTTAAAVLVRTNEQTGEPYGEAGYAYDTQTGEFVYFIGRDKPTLDVRRAEALAEIGRGERLS